MTAERRSFAAEAWRRMVCHTWLKGVGTTVFMTAFFMVYFAILRNPQFPVWPVPLTALDYWIDFQPAALPVYATLWLYVSLPPAFFAERRRLYAYGWAVGSLCLAGLAIFYFLPTATPAALVDWERYPGFTMLKGLDTNGNACPSLHVATAIFSGLWLHRLLAEMGGGRRWQAGNALWCLAIVYSTLATKQHVAIDVLTGAAFGWFWQVASNRLLFRPPPFSASDTKTV